MQLVVFLSLSLVGSIFSSPLALSTAQTLEVAPLILPSNTSLTVQIGCFKQTKTPPFIPTNPRDCEAALVSHLFQSILNSFNVCFSSENTSWGFLAFWRLLKNPFLSYFMQKHTKNLTPQKRTTGCAVIPYPPLASSHGIPTPTLALFPFPCTSRTVPVHSS